MIRMILLLSMLMVLTACSEFALLMSAGSVAATQNTYTKVYNICIIFDKLYYFTQEIMEEIIFRYED